MPQWRKIHPDYFDSPSVDAMCLAAQRLWQALWCLSDEWGRGKLAPRAIEGFAFPGRSINELTYGHHGTIDELLAEVAEHCSVIFYEVGHSLCWQCTSWAEYQAIKHKDRQSAVPAYEPGVHKRLYVKETSEGTLNVPSPPNSSQAVPSPPNSSQAVPFPPKTSREGEGEGEIVSSSVQSLGGPGEQNRPVENLEAAAVESPAAPAPAGAGQTPTKPRPTDDADFDAFWATYPRRVDKKPARKAWRSARRRAPAAQIIAGATEYARQVAAAGTQPRFIKHPSTWLNADGWTETEHTPPPAVSRADQNTIDAIARSAQTGGRGVFADLFEPAPGQEVVLS